MKVLIATTPQKLKRTKPLWSALARLAEVQIEVLGDGPYRDLRDLSKHRDFDACDRIIIDHNLRRMGSEYRHLKRIPRQILFDFDFCQNYIPEVGYNGRLESVLKTIDENRIVVSSVHIKRDLQAKGFDAEFSPKAYDPDFIRDLGGARDVELGFIGRTRTRAYSLRRAMLDRLTAAMDLKILRTAENEDYNRMLNRIQIFICPDHGYHELMIKNYEAMAAGCALVTSRPHPEEVDSLGFVDFENVVLYENFEELTAKVAVLRKSPELRARIAAAGRELATRRHRWEDRAEPLLGLLQAPPRRPPPLTWRDRWALLLVMSKKSKYAS